MSTKVGAEKISRLRCCCACGHRWQTVELSTSNVSRMEQAVEVVRSFGTLSKELDAAAHG
ncbi:hypothetical protein [Pseudorhodoferax sp.]|uniref:hypothetical protein n=1 Tax=Pseudorhodoferax sp. TaxID=1993553 RepID=UPI0039E63EA2